MPDIKATLEGFCKCASELTIDRGVGFNIEQKL